jgi:uncharacterized cupin superfamily protein
MSDVPEARLEATEDGLAPAGEGWFVINLREGRWRRCPGRGLQLALTGVTDAEAETLFPLLGVNLMVLAPDEPNCMYHWETDQEGFLVLRGEALLIVEGVERALRQWDYAHTPPGAEHVLVGGGEDGCTVLAIGSRRFMAQPDWGGYTVNDAAARYGASVEEPTADPRIAYARFADSEPAPYPRGALPGE